MVKVAEVVVGAKFHRLTILSIFRGLNCRQHVNCKCDCGNDWSGPSKSIGVNNFSCGCFRLERVTKHGQCTLTAAADSPYHCWHSMMDRCYNPKSPNFKHYGGRGIAVCEGWHDLLTFVAWAESAGYKKKLTIERDDVNGGYSPENCRWISMQEQAFNRRSSVWLEAWGERKILSHWLRDERLVVKSESAVRKRLARGMSSEEAFTTPNMGGLPGQKKKRRIKTESVDATDGKV